MAKQRHTPEQIIAKLREVEGYPRGPGWQVWSRGPERPEVLST